MSPEQREVIEEWRRDMKLIYGAHYASSVEAQRLNYWLGIPVMVLSGIVGTGAFLALAGNPSTLSKVAVGCTSLLVAVLAALQTFMRYSERAENHRKAGAKFAALRKEIDQLLVCPPKEDDELKEWLGSFRQRWDQLSLESPTTSPSTWARRKTELRKDEIAEAQQRDRKAK